MRVCEKYAPLQHEIAREPRVRHVHSRHGAKRAATLGALHREDLGGDSAAWHYGVARDQDFDALGLYGAFSADAARWKAMRDARRRARERAARDAPSPSPRSSRPARVRPSRRSQCPR